MKCTVCGDSIFAEPVDGMHPCCAIWNAREPGAGCRGCRASKLLNRYHRERQDRRAHRDRVAR